MAQLLATSSYYLIIDEGYRTLSGFVQPELGIGTFALVILCAAPLLLRRAFPQAVWIATILLYGITQLAHTGILVSVAAPMVALYTLATLRPRREELVIATITCLVIALLPVIPASAALDVMVHGQNLAMVVAATALGDAARTRQESVLAASRRAEEAERMQEELAMRRVADERVRIAREVHDITAHSLSAVALQAAVAERLIKSDPTAAREAIGAVRATAKDSLDELRAIVGVLRGPNQAETAPTATTKRLDEVVSYLEKAGVAVTLDTSHYEGATVPLYLDVALFGIVREATTNIVKHAHAAHARITLGTQDGWAHLTIEDDGSGITGQGATTPGGGHGIIGMRERASALGGTLHTSPPLPNERAQEPRPVFDGKTVDDIAFGSEPFNAEALGVATPHTANYPPGANQPSAAEENDQHAGFTVMVAIPLQSS
ncbi:MAG: sensor histidine kinase [Coriobacteriales bacterium]|jgi:signal transduction histidine kinase|nr:sensor histidine kinase [Coriobacteriales bacterium]